MKKKVVVRSLPILFLVSFVLVLSGGCGRQPAEHKVVAPRDGAIRIPVGEVHDGKVHFFTYRKSGKRINFFIRTDGNDNLSASFDACFTCYKHKKGYRAEGTDLVCNECGLKFRLADERWDNSGGCSPIALTSRIANNKVLIATEDLEKGLKLF